MQFLFILSICFFAGIFFPPQTGAETAKIVIATDDWVPYISKAHPGRGKFAEIVSLVFKEMGIEVEYIFAPWKRVEALVKSGNAFAAVPYAYTEERHKVFDYSVPVMNSSYVFFYNKKTYPHGISYQNLEELKHYRINGVTGYWYETTFAKAKLNVEYVTSDEQGIIKLFFNRVDLAASDSLVGWELIKKLYPNQAAQFGVVEKPFGTQYLHLMVSRNYPNAKELTEKFNATFKSMQSKGRLPSS